MRARALQGLAAGLWAVAAAPAAADTPVSNLIIGGGMLSCTSNAGTARCARDDWAQILREDAALAALRPEQLLRERQRPAPVVSYRIDAAALARLQALPAELLPAALRTAVVARLQAATPGPLAREALEALAWPEGPPEPIPRAALLHALAEPAPPEPRLVQARSVALLTDPASRAIHRELVDAARTVAGGQRPRIGIITAASRHPFNDHDIYVHALASAGAEPVWIPLDGALRRALDQRLCGQLPALYNGVANTAAGAPPIWHPERQFPDLARQQREACEQPAALHAQLAGLHGLFLSGGDQGRLLDALLARDADGRYTRPSRELQILRERHAAGRLVVAGSSAGNAAQAGGLWQGRPVPMLGGGESARVLAEGFHAGAGPVSEAGARVGLSYAEGGLGFFSLGPLDSHFGERGREGRLVRHVLDHGLPYGFGVDENTALLLHRPAADGSRRLRVVGAGAVFIVDARQAQRGPGADFAATALRVHRLHEGDEALLDARGGLSVQLAPREAPPPLDAAAAEAQLGGVDRPLGFARLVAALAESGSASATGLTAAAGLPVYRLRLQRDERTRLAALAGGRYSVAGLRLDVLR